MNNSYGDLYTGALGYFNDLSLHDWNSDSSNRNHINNEVWAYTEPDESMWIEAGLRAGFAASSLFPGSCNCNTYIRFWEDRNSDGYLFGHLISYPSADGSQHAYQIQARSASSAYWDVYIDYNRVGTSTNQLSRVLYEVQAGMEDTDVSPNTSSDLFDNKTLYYRTGNYTSWVPWPYHKAWIDHGCPGGVPNGHCLQGRAPVVNEWLDQKA